MSVVKTVGNAIKEVAEPLNAGVSVFNGINSSIQAHKNRDAQREANYQNMQENQRNRDFNAQQADLQRQWSAQQTSIQNAFNAEQAEKAFQRSAKFEREMLEREAELNSPNNMLKQYQEAGFNPNLFGGQIPAASAGSASSPSAQGSNPSGASASAGSSIPIAPVTYSNPMFEAAQIRLANAQARNLEEKSETERESRPYVVEGAKANVDLLNSSTAVNYKNEAYLSSKIDEIATNIDLMNSEIAKNDALRQGIQLDNDGKVIINSHLEDRLLAEIEELNARRDVQLANAKEVVSKICLNYALAEQAHATAGAQNALAGLYDAETQSYALPNYLDGVELQFRKKNQKYYTIVRNIQKGKEKLEFKIGLKNLKGDAIQSDYNDSYFWNFTREYTADLGRIFGGSANVSTSTSKSNVSTRSVIKAVKP